MGAIVTFDYDAWKAMFAPAFNDVTAPLAADYFLMATTLHANDGSGPVTNSAIQSMLLNQLTAHFAALFFTPSGGTPSSLVGRLSSATEGSVTVQTELNVPPSFSMAFFSQTKYGLAYWQMSSGYRTMQYRVSRKRRGPVPSGAGWV